jgi:hypothetical protein
MQQPRKIKEVFFRRSDTLEEALKSSREELYAKYPVYLHIDSIDIKPTSNEYTITYEGLVKSTPEEEFYQSILDTVEFYYGKPQVDLAQVKKAIRNSYRNFLQEKQKANELFPQQSSDNAAALINKIIRNRY